MGFEKGVIRKLATMFPELSHSLMSIHDNIKDLMTSFQNKHYYNPAMQEVYKEHLMVHHGGEEMEAFLKNMPYMSDNIKKCYREALLAYCHLDTLAMIKILEKLKSL